MRQSCQDQKIKKPRRNAVVTVFILYPPSYLNLNFQPLEVVARYRDPQLQVAENITHVGLIWD